MRAGAEEQIDAARKKHQAGAHKTGFPIGWHEGLSPDCNPYLRPS